MPIRRDGNEFHATPTSAGERLRIVLLRSDDPHQRWLERALVAHELQLVATVVEPGAAQQARLRARPVAWRARRYQVLRQRWTGRAAYRCGYFDALAPGGARAPQTVTVDSISSDRCVAAVAGFAPDAIVVCGTTIVADEVIASVPLAVNVHAGYLPDYRGNHAIYIAYERGDFHRIGASLHLVTSELDGGHVIDVWQPEIYPHDHDEHLYCRSVHGAGLRLCALLRALEGGAPLLAVPQRGTGETFRHRDRTPTRELRLWLRRRLGRHPVPHLQPSGHDADVEHRG